MEVKGEIGFYLKDNMAFVIYIYHEQKKKSKDCLISFISL